MNYRSIFIIGSILLSACTPQRSGMGMNHGMMRGDNTVDAGGTSVLLSEKDIDLSTLPEASASQIIEVHDGDTIDLNPEIVKKTINGTSFAFYSYNGQFPGPTIKAAQGSTFTVRVKNNIDQPTTVHWHGIRIDNRFDGIPGLTQDAIEPGKSFTYTVTVPDEGMYWYHPHAREDMQQDLGLYGNLWVTPKNANTYAAVNREIPVFVDDILLGNNGTPLSYGKEEADHALMGRFGNTMLTNGAINPILAEAKSGDVVRFFFTNTANTRTFKLAFDGAQMKLVGGDGGKIHTERLVESITLAPSERAIVDVLFEKTGEVKLKHIGPQRYALASVQVKSTPASPSYGQEFSPLGTNAEMPVAADLVREYSAKDPDETIHLSVTQPMMGEMQHGGMMQHGSTVDGIEWEDAMPMMNAVTTKANTQWKLIDATSGKENMDIRYQFRKGDKVKIRIVNDRNSAHPMQHPIHFHGQRFLVLAVDGKPSENLVWKDTVLVPKDATVDILLDITNPGDWMIHCHIAEHLSNGMMGMFTVE
ncbi:MAG: multicopper oxidase type 3 [Candidatus Peregrinibacteria bacterium Greene0416_62]|nr:MAG: multicopper oxidase type 3 [Candidatus Peregrinibacteria bacterium Greene0416_62]